MSDLIKVSLSGPAKIGARWFKQGEADVTADERLALEEAGLILPASVSTAKLADLQATGAVAGGEADGATAASTDPVPVFDQAAFDAAVAAQAQLLAGQAFDGELAKMEAELKEIVALAAAESQKLTMERDTALGQATDAVAKAADLSEKLTAVTAELDALKAAQTTSLNTTVAKTTAKKGAATS